MKTTPQNRYTAKGTRPKPRKDRNRRRRVQTVINLCRSLTRGAKATGFGMLERSSDTAKPIWGNQEKLAAEIGMSDRQFRRDVLALEEAGIIEVTRTDAEQCPVTGQWSRPQTNVYSFIVPPAVDNRVKSREKTQQNPIGHESPFNQQPTVVNETFGNQKSEISVFRQQPKPLQYPERPDQGVGMSQIARLRSQLWASTRVEA